MRRYDRQERLWSKSGQRYLENSHIWAIGKSAAMTEALKNLALAGIGKLSLTMTAAPLDTFFDNEIQPLRDQLIEMNPEASVNYTECAEGAVDLILITANDYKAHNETNLPNVPRLVLGSCLFRGAVSLQRNGLLSIPILEPHPSSGLSDLRFEYDTMWPEYQQFCDSYDLNSLSEMEHRHVPYCVLLVKALRSSGPGGDARQVLAQMQKYDDEDNFNEARRQIWRTKAKTIPDGIQELIKFGEVHDLASKDARSHIFWVLVKALGKFIEIHKCLPLSGIIPDMASTSAGYTELRRIYSSRAQHDADEMHQLAGEPVPKEYVKSFCENSRFIKALVYDDNEKEPENAYLDEFCGSTSQEIPPVSAFVGGIAAQEAMKLLMRQYTPINGTLIYDGSTQTTCVKQGCMRLIN